MTRARYFERFALENMRRVTIQDRARPTNIQKLARGQCIQKLARGRESRQKRSSGPRVTECKRSRWPACRKATDSKQEQVASAKAKTRSWHGELACNKNR